MIKRITLALACCLTALLSNAMPACPTPQVLSNPDGSGLLVQLQGDEFYHFHTTADGYTVVRDNDGYWVYAAKENGRLAPTVVRAHDAAQRDAAEAALLSTMPRMLVDEQSVANSKKTRARRDSRMRIEQSFDPSKFRGLVILVNFSDRQFVRGDVNQFFQRLLNEKNYTGYTAEDGSYSYYGSIFTGSVSDYFSDNTMGVFTPQFDVVGPINVDASCRQDDSMGAFAEVFKQAIKKADAQVDFSKYDNDGDGVIDLLYFIAAGFGSSYNGNDSQYLWPHAWYIFGDNVEPLDGVWPGRYACSVEFYGWEDPNYGYTHDGIGTICHEFSHCLGLPDLYDTDYGNGGGQSHVPGKWDVMSGGGHLNYSRTPAGYSLYDRYATGFAHPTVIKSEGSYTLNPIGTSNEGYIIETPNSKEKFLVENRQQSNKWDAYIPGSGMLVARMDSTNAEVWNNNTLNCDPAHNYYELLRAGGGTSGDDASDAFPGTAGVTQLVGDDTETPNLLTWDGQANDYGLTEIKEQNGVISFNIVKTTPPLTLVEDFEKMPVSTGKNSQHQAGNFALWTLTNARVVADNDDCYNGLQGLAMTKPAAAAMEAPVAQEVTRVTYQVINPTNTATNFGLQYTTDGGSTWTDVPEAAITVEAKSTVTANHKLALTAPAQLRLVQSSGSSTKAVYVDDITLQYRRLRTDVTTYPLQVAGVDVNNYNAARVLGDGIGGIVSYDPATLTLTLDGATVNGGATKGIVSQVDGLKIVATGTNQVLSATTVGTYAIDLAGPTTIGGDGYLYVNGYRGVQMTGNGATMLTVGDNVTLEAEGAQIGLAGASKVRSRILIDYYSTLRVKDNATLKTIGHTSYTTIDWLDMLLEDGHAITAPAEAFFDDNIHRIAVPYGEYNEMVDKWVVIEKVQSSLAGDVDGNGLVNGSDVTALYNHLLNGNATGGNADVDGNKVVNGSDVTALYNILLTQ